MKILLISDSHGENYLVQAAAIRNQDCDLYLHAGDSQAYEYEIEPFVSVKGNCDYLSDYPESRIITTPYGNLLITHGHLMYKYGLKYLKDNDIKICVTGHTHKKRYEIIDDIIFINPGSVSLPRDGTIGTYVILNITKDKVEYEFKEI